MKFKFKNILFSFVIIVTSFLFLTAAAKGSLTDHQRIHLEKGCINALKILADAEISYFKNTPGHNFTGYEELINAGFLSPAFDDRQINMHYVIARFDTRRSTYWSGESAHDSTFTVIAIPIDPQNKLRTFALDQNFEIFEYVGNDIPAKIKDLNVSFDNPSVWKLVIRTNRTFWKTQRMTWENDCKNTLRQLGSSQLSYAERNRNHDYGTWMSLKESGYIKSGLTRANIIAPYSIVVFNVRTSLILPGKKSAMNSDFTIVAIPRSQRHGLRTFGIAQDQRVRMWKGHGLEPNHVFLLNDIMWQPERGSTTVIEN